MNKKIGIITFHRSHNCGSMLQAYALQTVVQRLGFDVEMINFSNKGQRELYKPLQKVSNLKILIKDIIAIPHLGRLNNNAAHYEQFLRMNFNLGVFDYSSGVELYDTDYNAVISGSDQVWNITIADSDDAYFLPWVKRAKKIAYAVSFGAKNIIQYANNPVQYAEYIKSFDAVSTREFNGRRWIKELAGIDVPVVLDPTLLLEAHDYTQIEDNIIKVPSKYIFYYSPSYNPDINKLVKSISKKYGLPVIGFNSKAFYIRGMNFSGFTLPTYEDPSVYLTLMRHASLVITTSFHGTIFSTIYRKPFWTIKNGDMFGDDDRVLTLMQELGLQTRLIPIEFDSSRDYTESCDYSDYCTRLSTLKAESLQFLKKSLKDCK